MKDNLVRKSIWKIKNYIYPTHTNSESDRYISERIKCGKPLMISRFGAVEIKAFLYKCLPPPYWSLVEGLYLQSFWQ